MTSPTLYKWKRYAETLCGIIPVRKWLGATGRFLYSIPVWCFPLIVILSLLVLACVILLGAIFVEATSKEITAEYVQKMLLTHDKACVRKALHAMKGSDRNNTEASFERSINRCVKDRLENDKMEQILKVAE